MSSIVIDTDETFEDIRDSEARKNYDEMLGYLCCKAVPDEIDEYIEMPTGSFAENHAYLSNFLYSKENKDLANYILNERSEIGDNVNYNINKGLIFIPASASIYNLDKDKLLKLGSNKYFESLGSCEHELVHLLQAINGKCRPQYVELLSIFTEMVSMELLSEKYGNPDIYKNFAVMRYIKTISDCVFTYQLEDEYLKKYDILKEKTIEVYPYSISYIYAVRLFDIYHSEPDKVLENVNNVLSGKKSVDNLLADYNISCKNEATISSFKNFCNSCEGFVMEKNSKSEVHYIKY